MPEPIDISPKDLVIVRAILSHYVPEYEVRAFGSRVAWTAKEHSDLDLAVMTDKPLKATLFVDLKEVFTDSDLSIKVDVVDWAKTGVNFRKIIEGKFMVVQKAGQQSAILDDWITKNIGQVTNWKSGGTPRLNNPQYWNGNIPWISASSMKTPWLSESERRITPAGLEAGSNLAPKDSVLLLVRGSELHKRIPIGVAMKEVAFNQDVKSLLTKDGLRSRFLYYWLKAHEAFLLSKVEHTGIGAGKLDTDIMQALPISFPKTPEQQERVLSVFVALDGKIELNRKMNETLEAMARALFKSWFVDFDPVRAKAEGRDTGLPKDIATLFPDSFVDSELGEIPKGWSVGTLGDVSDHPRRTIQSDEIQSTTPYIALEHMPRRSIAIQDWDYGEGLESNKFKFEKGEILFGKLRPYFHKVGVAPVDGVCSTDIVVICPKSEDWFGFVLGHVSSDVFVEYTNAASTGTKMPRTNWGDMAHYELVLPSSSIAKAFTKTVRVLTQKIEVSVHESRALASVRDSLLPKLISGELRVM